MIISLVIICAQIALCVMQAALVIRVAVIQRHTRRTQAENRATLEKNRAALREVEAKIETLAEYRVFKEQHDKECNEEAFGIYLALWLTIGLIAVSTGLAMPTIQIQHGSDDGR